MPNKIPPDKRGGLNGLTQHWPEVLSAGVSMAKFVRERCLFKENTALFRFMSTAQRIGSL
jgi:hypothetical protein